MSDLEASPRDEEPKPAAVPGTPFANEPDPPEHGDAPAEATSTLIPASRPETEEAVMSLVEHLAELRRRIAISIAAVAAGTVLGLFATPRVLEILKAPVPGPLIFLDPGGAFFLQLRIALMIGVAVAFPVILYQFWAFVSPGLTRRERDLARPWLPVAIVLFVIGVALAYFVLPFTVGFLLGFEIPGVIESQLEAGRYFGFVTFLFLAFGIVMEFPIFLVLLNRMGMLSLDRLRRSRRYVLLGIVIFAVVITPGGDPVSPAIMTGVMYLLYEVTIAALSRSGARERSLATDT